MAKPDRRLRRPAPSNLHRPRRRFALALLAALLAASSFASTPPPARADALEEANRAIRAGDPEAAARHLERGARAGVAEAQYQLASLARSGRGVPKSHATALRWFKAAAEQGHAKAQYSLGKMYQNGWGVEADRGQALHWYREAAQQGHRLAAQQLKGAGQDAPPGMDSAAAALNLDPSKPAEALRRAVQKGDETLVRQLLRGIERDDARLHATDRHGRSVLHEAVERHEEAIARRLVQAGADPNLADAQSETPLMRAARDGDEALLREMVGEIVGKEPGASAALDRRDGEGRSALMLAARRGQLDCVSTLLDAGADPRARDATGMNAADLAQRGEHASVVRLLSKRGGRPTAKKTREQSDRRAWLQQATNNANSTNTSNNANNNTNNNTNNNSKGGYGGWPPLVVASWRGQQERVRELLAARVAIDARDPEGFDALGRACWRGHAAIAKRLLEAGSKPDTRQGTGLTALGLAARGGHGDIVTQLLQRGANADAPQGKDGSPLLLALQGRHTATALLLIEKGVETNWGPPHDTSALELSMSLGDRRLIEALARQPGFHPTASQLAVAACAASVGRSPVGIEMALGLGANVDTKCRDGRTLLVRATGHETDAFVRVLIDHRADVDARGTSGNTALMIAAHAGRLDLVGLLLDSGADIDARGHGRECALMTAARAGRAEVVARLLERGAKPGLRNDDGKTARQLAEIGGHPEVVRVFDLHAERGGGWLDLF